MTTLIRIAVGQSSHPVNSKKIDVSPVHNTAYMGNGAIYIARAG